MNYFDIINKAIEVTVLDAGNGLSYLEPRYREVLRSMDLIDNGVIDNEELFEVLKLEVEKRNAINNKVNGVIDWIDNVVNSMDAAMTDEENDMFKNMMEYMKMNEQVKEKEKELEQREIEVSEKEKAKGALPAGLNLAKRK